MANLKSHNPQSPFEKPVIVKSETDDTSSQVSESDVSLKTLVKKNSEKRLPYFSPTCVELEVVRRMNKRKPQRPPQQPSYIVTERTEQQIHIQHSQRQVIETNHLTQETTPSRKLSSSSSYSSSTLSSLSSSHDAVLNEDLNEERTPTPVPPRSVSPYPSHSSSSTSSSSLSYHRHSIQHESTAITLQRAPVVEYSTPSSTAAISWDVHRGFDSLIPDMYVEAAQVENIPLTNLESLFTEDGLQIARCFAALRYRKDVIEEFRCRLMVARDEPVYKMDNLTEGKSRLLLPDLHLGPTTSPTALDAFAHYVWPSGDRQLQDMKHVCGVMCTFRNLREPIYFATPDTDQQRFVDCFTVVRRAAIIRDGRRRQSFPLHNSGSQKYSAPPSPSKVARDLRKNPSCLSEHSRISSEFAKILECCAKKLATTRAIERFWVQEMEVFVIFWNERKQGRGKYKRDKLQVYINPYKPELTIANKKGETLADILDLTAFSCSRLQLGDPDTLPSCIK
eukprot:Gregarina_sp_Poly_1__2635@NODE_1719_length_3471_cov_249_786428_g118_i1_p1_GENE_NODE_1719_length_3471_cov_249_786428_g118_i1NODE_1719_length_3471_cov_249_786428_g118_i1_p1_ORF_typecomplete_len507_score70_68KAR9/PF08580_10/0_18KAR9/PF08580_10/7e02_NODE_1719_length_3471_cov_249_786428_g118_i11051625